MKILFMCVANSARSQLAEGLAKEIFSKSVEIQSAGSKSGHLNPIAIKVMEEIGIDISKQYSKSTKELRPEFVEGLDFIVTLCAEEVCPVIFAPHAKKLHWPFSDPASKEIHSEVESLQHFRQVRDSISAALRKFKLD